MSFWNKNNYQFWYTFLIFEKNKYFYLYPNSQKKLITLSIQVFFWGISTQNSSGSKEILQLFLDRTLTPISMKLFSSGGQSDFNWLCPTILFGSVEDTGNGRNVSRVPMLSFN